MIKIIKAGTKKVTKCECCGCEFSYEDEDLLIDQHDVMVSIYCPQCEQLVVLKQIKGVLK